MLVTERANKDIVARIAKGHMVITTVAVNKPLSKSSVSPSAPI